jgi:tRNA-specific 2-thiouridylase
LKRRIPGLEEKVHGGMFIDKDGHILGRHKGYPFYTIGQRRGLGIALGKPYFVSQIHPDTNTIVLGLEDELEHNGMFVRNLNMLKYDVLPDGYDAAAKIRYKTPAEQCTLYMQESLMKVEFQNPVTAITPGQSAVFYEGDDVIGGGHILSSYKY